MQKTRQYQYLLKPDLKQKEKIVQLFGATRFVYNRFLDDRNSGKLKSALAKEVVADYLRRYPFLNQVNSSALIHTIFQAQDQIRSLKRYRRRSDSYCSFTVGNLIRKPIRILDDHRILIPDLGPVEMIYHRPIPTDGEIKKATVIRRADGKYYVSVTVTTKTVSRRRDLDPAKSIGIDYSSTYFYVDDKGDRIRMPHFYKEKESAIAALDQMMSQCIKGSNNYYKLKTKRAEIFAGIKNRRKDFLHKLSTQLAEAYDVVCIEDIDMKEISQNPYLGKRTYDNAFGEFTEMLKYKLEERGKILLKAERSFPSSKICSKCGSINRKMTIEDRVWKCPDCETVHDRDVNAAINIKNRCLMIYFGRRAFGSGLS